MTLLQVFFGNIIFALTARTLSGNHLNLVIHKNYTVKCFLFGAHPGISLAVSRLQVQNVFVTGKKYHTTVGVVHGFVHG